MNEKPKTPLLLLCATLALLAFAGSPHRACAQHSEQIEQAGQAAVPESSWVYPAVAKLYERGLVSMIEGRSPFWFKKTLSRFEAAVFIGRALDRAEVKFRDKDSSQGKGLRLPLGYDLSDVALLKRLVKEFAAELQVLGVARSDAARILNKMEQAAGASAAGKAFVDVPSNHWAYSSVERLRQAGIVVGYPGGIFRSGQRL